MENRNKTNKKPSFSSKGKGSQGNKKSSVGGKFSGEKKNYGKTDNGFKKPYAKKTDTDFKKPYGEKSDSNYKKPYGKNGENEFAKPYKKHSHVVTDSATGEALEVSKRPKRKKKTDSERKASNGTELAKAIQWFPGHMTKAIREINTSLSYVDIAIELCDARIPVSSRNPNIEKILGGKPYITLMNKSSLADPNEIAKWKKHFADEGKTVIFTDCRTGTGICEILPAIRTVLAEKLAAYERKGMNRIPRAMILGVTNSGKSTLINKLCGQRKAKAQDKAGVTRSQQWVTVEGGAELLDTPGILWPKFDDENVGLHLAFTGAIRDEILDTEEIAVILCKELCEKYPNLMMQRFKLTKEDMTDKMPFEIFEAIGRSRSLLISGGEVDTLRTARMLIDEFRDGKIGRITLETV